MLVDLLAYKSLWRFVHPGEKLVLCGVFLLWGFLPFPWIHFGLVLVIAFLLFWSGVSWRSFSKLLLTPLLFILPGVLVVLFSSQGNVTLSVQLALRSLLLWMSFLLVASTTPVPDMLGFLRNFRPLQIVTDVALLTYRYLFVLSARAERVYLAQQARLGYGSYRQGLQSLAFLIGGLFLYTFQVMEQFRFSLEARGCEGELAVLPPRFRPLCLLRIVLFLGIGMGGVFLVLLGGHR
ncbi:MAG: energy-coupling factor transporter transmembrane component T [Atribacterota bacterium]